jgi:hypothetical protein
MNIITIITTAIKVIQAAYMLAGYLDEIKDLVWKAENYFPETGSGAKRLRWVRQQLEQSLVLRERVEKLWPHIDTWITWFVNKYVNKV